MRRLADHGERGARAAIIAKVHAEWSRAWEGEPVPDGGGDVGLHHVDAGENPAASDDFERRLAEALAEAAGGDDGAS